MRLRRIAVGLLGLFAGLAVCVHLGLLNAFDAIVGGWARPHNAWGRAQMLADLVVEGLRPAVLAGLLTAFTIVCCLRRRSLRPAVFVTSVFVATIVVTIAAKVTLGRPDTHGLVGPDGGSFPSGHIVAVMVGLGVVLLVARPASHWMWLLPALGGCLMGACLLIQAAHWATDVVGGALLSSSILAFAADPGWSRWSSGRRGMIEHVRLPERDMSRTDRRLPSSKWQASGALHPP